MAINGVTFDLRTVKSPDDSILNIATFGTDGYLYGCALSSSGMNLTVAKGYFVANGRLIQLDADYTSACSTTTDGYCRLKFQIDLSQAASGSSFTQGSFVWEWSATNSFTALAQEDLFNSNTTYEIEVCRASIASTNITVIRQWTRIGAFTVPVTLTDSATLEIIHAGLRLLINKATAVTITVPPNSSVAFPIGTEIELVQYGAGQVTIAAGSGVTIRSKDSALKTVGQYSTAAIVKIGADEWLAVGSLEA